MESSCLAVNRGGSTMSTDPLGLLTLGAASSVCSSNDDVSGAAVAGHSFGTTRVSPRGRLSGGGALLAIFEAEN